MVKRMGVLDKFYMLAISSLRPVQFLIALCGYVAAIGLSIAYSTHNPTPMDAFIAAFGFAPVVAYFLVYATLLLLVSAQLIHSGYQNATKYAASCMGIVLWSFSLASAVKIPVVGPPIIDGMSIMYIVPLLGDTWALVQLWSGVRQVQRYTTTDT